ncbi:MAG: peptidoglycan-associated lipoprotein Pal [Syntrophaceae bacterium]|nr:peptidoglycan-associated lipoprotein Pal [Syntrophaceae bacterium]
MGKSMLRMGLAMVMILGLLMFIQACAKEPVVKEDIAQPPQAVQVPKEQADTGELAKLGKTVSDEATPAAAGKSERLGYFVVSTPAGDYVFYDIHFDFDKYNIRPDDRDALNRYAKWFKDNPKYNVLIEGHCDEVGTVEYNLALGERRADTTRKYLIDMGVGAARIKTVSYGEEFPLDSSQTEEAFAKNRRAHFVVSLGN